jgi:hypothetical protein
MNATTILILITALLILAFIYIMRKFNTAKGNIQRLQNTLTKNIVQHSLNKDQWQISNDLLLGQLKDTKSRLLQQHIYQSLSQMDKIFKYYTDEDEANRELCVCLNVLGYNATYHANLYNRSIDVYLENTVIEGKLDPSQSDIDRLIGQVIEYLSFNKDVYIVIYGEISQVNIDRINQQLISRYDNVNLLYISEPYRTRQSQGILVNSLS